jgi:flagellar hook-associated protein 1 FlgK
MSLFGSIQMGSNTLQAMQIGLQVVGNNIANANTPGYVRQEAVYIPAAVQKQGNLILGLGVEVDGIIQKIDKFVLARLVGARGERANAEVQEHVYGELERVLNELSDENDLSSSLTGFFNAVDLIATEPDNVAARNLAVGKGITLTENINNLRNRVTEVRQQLDERVTAVADEINALAEQIRELNVQIAASEGGGSSSSEAGGLRVRRQTAVDRLSELIGIHVIEQPSGGLSISIGGDVLVFDGQRREVEVNTTASSGIASGVIEFTNTHAPLNTSTGELTGLYAARDEIAAGFLDRLDDLAATLAFEFNKVFSQGQGLVGFDQLTSNSAVLDAGAALDAAGLAFTPASGSFDLIVSNKSDRLLSETHRILIDLNGFDEDTSLDSLAEQLDAIEGISASVTTTGKLQIAADSTDIDFAFAGDTSGLLAALGLNTFFTGSTAASLGVNDELKGIDNAGKFAASSDGIGEGSGNAVKLAVFLDQPIDSAGGASLSDLYNQLIIQITQGASAAQSVADGFRTFEGSLESQAQSVSGVSIDEEAVKMLTLQRVFQASAKYIQTISELLELLVKL